MAFRESILRAAVTLDSGASVLRRACWPFLDLALRLWLAQSFFVSGVLKLTRWQTALYLAENEYPVSWLSPTAAAYTGAAVELIAPLLLTAGFLTRYAAFALLALSMVIQFSYQAHDSQLFWAALFGWYCLAGAGPLSVDRLLRRGIADSALPLAPRIVRCTEWLRRHLAPVYLSLVRVWLAVALAAAALAPAASVWLPVSSFVALPATAALAFGCLMLLGLGTRLLCALLVVVSLEAMIAGAASGYAAMVLALLAVRGGGAVALDRLTRHALGRRFPQLAGRPHFDLESAPKVVIVGAGFAGLRCAALLSKARAAITLIDRGNHHLFQPLLYQVATAGLSPADIATPIRSLFREAFNVRVLLGTVTGIDTHGRRVQLAGQGVDYDYLVVATGATHSYFGKDGWQPFAPGLKRIEDATEIRRRLLLAFERAEACEDETERRALLTFLIVGGGPTGVELAGAIAELSRFAMDKEFRRFDPAAARVILVQSGARILPSFPQGLAAVAHRSLERLGVEVLLGRVEDIDADGVAVSGRRIAARTVLWAAGVTASPAAAWLGAPADNAGRVKVDACLNVPDLPMVWVVGDTAASNAWLGKPVPGLAPAAKQGGEYAARAIRAMLEGHAPPPPFAYRHLGSLATIGRQAAVADFGRLKLWGAPAWWLWGLIHVGFLVGVRNRMATMMNWFWAYLTFGGGIRLITGAESPAPAAARSPEAGIDVR